VKLIEVEAILAGLVASPSPKTRQRYLVELARLSDELEAMCKHIENNDTLRTILDTFKRGSAVLDEDIRRTLNGPR
jgi:hypothetical protein